MKEAVKRINEQYGLELTEKKIERIAQQAADANALFEQLFIDGIDGVMPLPIVSRKLVKR
jgi:Asp-tRNA(Asn)/Glu-tRNA(Gln) amidotransferase C subunit